MISTRLLLILTAVLSLSACGIKGALFVPERPDIGAADGSKSAQEEPNK